MVKTVLLEYKLLKFKGYFNKMVKNWQKLKKQKLTKAEYYRIADYAATKDITVDEAIEQLKAKKKRKRLRIQPIEYSKLRKWRLAVLKRDNYTCQSCGLTESLHCHHIKWQIDCPDLRYSVKNGETLCEDCHDNIHDGLISYYKQQAWLKQVATEHIEQRGQ